MQAMERRYFPSAPRPRATTDYQLLALWLHSRPPASRRHCAAAVARFQRYVGHPLGTVTPDDVSGFADSLGDLAPTARARLVGAIRSFDQFAHRLRFGPSGSAARAGPPARRRATAPGIGSLPEREPAPLLHRHRRSPSHQARQRHPLRVARGSRMRRTPRLLGGRSASRPTRRAGHPRHRPVWHSVVGRRFPWSRSHSSTAAGDAPAGFRLRYFDVWQGRSHCPMRCRLARGGLRPPLRERATVTRAVAHNGPAPSARAPSTRGDNDASDNTVPILR
jgi:hypothetical protein